MLVSILFSVSGDRRGSRSLRVVALDGGNAGQLELGGARFGLAAGGRRFQQRLLGHVQRQFGGDLLTGAAASATAVDLDIQFRHQAFDLEFLAVGGAVGGHHVVLWQRNFLALQNSCSRVLASLPRVCGSTESRMGM